MNKRAAISFIFITVALDVLALGVVIPVLPQLIKSFVGQDDGRAAEVLGLFNTLWAAMQFFFSPLLGMLADRFGRRPVILLSNFGLGLDYILMALAPSWPWLLLGRILSGMTSASISVASAYIADITSVEKRSEAFGLIGVAFGVGFILGPALGGLLGAVDPHLPFWGAALLSLANGLYGYFVLPESLARENQTAFSWRKANPLGSFNLLRRSRALVHLSVLTFTLTLAHVVLPSIFVLYAGFRYAWGPREVGFCLAGVGLFNGLVQGLLISRFVRRFGERFSLKLGLIFGMVGFFIFGLAPNGLTFWIGVPFMALWGLAGAVSQGMLTELVSANEQGQLQGATGSLRGIAELVGPGLFTMTFAISITTKPALPGAPFFLAALLLFVSLAMASLRPPAKPVDGDPSSAIFSGK